MYESFFGLKDLPFRLTPDPAYLFMSGKHREAFAHLLYGVNEGSGFVAVTGEVGAGKTTLLRALLRETGEKVVVTYIVNPVLTSTELLQTINAELGLPSSSTSRKELIEDLHRFLRDTAAAGGRTVVIVDEAQNLDPVVLEQLRLLSNLETETEKLIQIVLVGQPELRKLLERHDLRQLNQRVTVRWHLDTLDPRESADYIRHRLSVAGATGELFEPKALDLIDQYAKGVPRLLNIIAHRSLLVAYTRNSGKVGVAEVAAAASELGHGNGPVGPRKRRWLYPLAAGLLIAGAVGVFTSLQASSSRLFAFALPEIGVDAGQDRAVPQPGSRKRKLLPGPSESGTGSVRHRRGIEGRSASEQEAGGSGGKSPPRPWEPGASAANPTAAGSGVGAVSRSPGDEKKRIEEILAAASALESAQQGSSRLFELWGEPPLGETETGSGSLDLESAAAIRGLRYFAPQTTFALVRELDLPALFELDLPSVGLRYALIEKASADASRLFTRSGIAIKRAWLDEWWNGRVHILWRDPEHLAVDLGPGSGGPSVERLQLLLAEAGVFDGQATGFFNEQTEQAVRRFQASHSVVSDGVAGPVTQIILYNSLRRFAAPRLFGEDGGRLAAGRT